ncbi:hypothetical protein VTN96DRAFT_793 [Rasamsonia emersonii]
MIKASGVIGGLAWSPALRLDGSRVFPTDASLLFLPSSPCLHRDRHLRQSERRFCQSASFFDRVWSFFCGRHHTIASRRALLRLASIANVINRLDRFPQTVPAYLLAGALPLRRVPTGLLSILSCLAFVDPDGSARIFFVVPACIGCQGPSRR